MLLRFRIENSKSFRDHSELSLIRTGLKGPDIVFKVVPKADSLNVLPSALIYGANASGKSNLFHGMSFYKRSILHSHRSGDPEGGVPREPFSLCTSPAEESTFESDFVTNDVRYTYGFSCDNERFTEEWLYSYPEGKRRVLYERSGSDVEFGSKFTGSKKQMVEFMRPNSLFISTATQNDHAELSKLVSFFRSWRFVSVEAVSSADVQLRFQRKDVDLRVLRFLDFVGVGVVGVKTEEMDLPENMRGLEKRLNELFRETLGSETNFIDRLEDEKRRSLKLGHRGANDEVFYLDMSMESSGTRRLIVLMDAIFKALDDGTTIFVDELGASLHTLVSEEIIKLFSHELTNPKMAQLIATTHDTNLLSSSEIRRDQIWFCERDKLGATELYSLAEMKSRQGDNFEQGYLEGRYGAIPYAGDVRLLFEAAQ